jgi:hypothetical protein
MVSGIHSKSDEHYNCERKFFDYLYFEHLPFEEARSQFRHLKVISISPEGIPAVLCGQ